MQGNRNPVREGLGFLGAFLRNPASVGAVVPSSRYLARALVGRIDHLAGRLLVEFGPGTGPMTAVIRDLLPKDARYLGIEINPAFHTILQQRFPDLDFHLGSAADIHSILRQRNLPQPARIVSGLPFASLPAKVQDAVIAGIVESLRGSDADFRTFQYVHAYGLRSARRFRDAMAERFQHFERMGPILRNIPPAYVLRYWGAR